MKRDFEWLKGEIAKRMIELEPYRADKLRDERYKTLRSVAQKLNQLDEPEVLSQEWLNNNSVNASHDGVTEEYIHVVDLKNLIVPKQDLPVIPKYVAEWIEEVKDRERTLYGAMSECPREVDYWLIDGDCSNQETFARAWMDGYTVEKEQKYYAKIKGWELFADFVGVQYWGVVSVYGRLGFVSADDAKDNTKDEWKRLGIDDSNAEFVEVV